MSPGLGPRGLARRSAYLQALRGFFLARNYIETDTPGRLPALLPEAHIFPFASEDRFLQPSPEQCMKRLLARGATRIFQICPCFRKEERGRLHRAEFTMLEWYRAHADYRDLMAECEALMAHLCRELADFPAFASRPDVLRRQGHDINLAPPWERLTVHEAFRRFADLTPEEALARDCFEEILVERIEPHLGMATPTFLCDYPAALASLARKSPDNPAAAERFELYVAGMELANGFSELNDPAEQERRFAAEIELIRAQGREAVMPVRFLEDLARMPAAAGIALGVDRLLMVLMDAEDIGAVLAFPDGTL